MADYKIVTIKNDSGSEITYKIDNTGTQGPQLRYQNKLLFNFDNIQGNATTITVNDKEFQEISAFFKLADCSGKKQGQPDGIIDFNDTTFMTRNGGKNGSVKVNNGTELGENIYQDKTKNLPAIDLLF